LTGPLSSNTITGNTLPEKNYESTTKGQVTIPKHIREKLGITPSAEVDFIEEKGRIILVKRNEEKAAIRKFAKLRGFGNRQMKSWRSRGRKCDWLSHRLEYHFRHNSG
jgi:AbrB family looped-hinge helix DNA binding protein